MEQDDSVKSKLMVGFFQDPRIRGVLASALAFVVGVGLGAIFFPMLRSPWALCIAALILLLIFVPILWYAASVALYQRFEDVNELLAQATTEKELVAVSLQLGDLPLGRLIKSMLDIASRKNAEQFAMREELHAKLDMLRRELMAREHSFNHLKKEFSFYFQSLSTPLFQLSHDGRFLKANVPFADLFGYESPLHLQEEVWDVGKALFTKEREYHDLQHSLQEENMVTKEVLLRGRAGGAIPAKICVWRFIDEHGNKLGMQGYVISLIEEREAFETKLKLQTAEYKNSAKTSFLSSISHRLRTPLHSLLGVLDLLPSKYEDAQFGEYIQVLQQSGQEITEITSDILDLTGLEVGTFTLDIAPFNLHGMLDELSEKIRPQTEARGLIFNWAILGSLPHFVIGDRWRLQQVLLNLLDNSIKYTRSGVIELTVERDPEQSAEIDKECLFFQVRDSGDGIEKETLRHMFDIFYRGGNAEKFGYAGSGLGLSICKGLVEAMGGVISIESRLGLGTWARFTVCLAYQTDALDSSLYAARPAYVIENIVKEYHSLSESFKENITYPIYVIQDMEPKALELILVDDDRDLVLENKMDIPPLDILLVDDSPNSRLLFSLFMRDTPHRLVEAGNGEEALVLFGQKHFDIIFMDMKMPLLDGYQATKLIRAMEDSGNLERTPIIGLTANVQPESQNVCLEAGCDAFMPKPFSLNSILKVLTLYGHARQHADAPSRASDASDATYIPLK